MIQNTFQYSIILIAFFFGLKNEDYSSSTESTLKYSANAVIYSDSCTEYLYLDNTIPIFVFDQNTIFAESVLSEKWFGTFDKTYHQANEGRTYVTFSKSKNNSQTEVNTYTFLLLNGRLLLEYAEINFSSEFYKVNNPENYQLEHKQKLIDVGMNKEQFQYVFSEHSSHFCDSIRVNDDTSESRFYFRNNVLRKIIVNLYTP